MVFVVTEGIIDLSQRQVRQDSFHDVMGRVAGLAVTDDDVDANARPFRNENLITCPFGSAWIAKSKPVPLDLAIQREQTGKLFNPRS